MPVSGQQHHDQVLPAVQPGAVGTEAVYAARFDEFVFPVQGSVLASRALGFLAVLGNHAFDSRRVCRGVTCEFDQVCDDCKCQDGAACARDLQHDIAVVGEPLVPGRRVAEAVYLVAVFFGLFRKDA